MSYLMSDLLINCHFVSTCAIPVS